MSIFAGSVTSNRVVDKHRGRYRYVFLDAWRDKDRVLDVLGGVPECKHKKVNANQKCEFCGATVGYIGRELTDDRFNWSMMSVLMLYNPVALFVLSDGHRTLKCTYDRPPYPEAWRGCQGKFLLDHSEFDCISRTGRLPGSVYFDKSVLWINPKRTDFMKYGCDYVLCNRKMNVGLFVGS